METLHEQTAVDLIGQQYRDFYGGSNAKSNLAKIRDLLEKRDSLQFSSHYGDEIRPLIREIVAWEMLLYNYLPGRKDRIEFAVIEALPVSQVNLMFATGLVEASRISHPRVFIRGDLLPSAEFDEGSVLTFFRTYAEEIRHSIEALWRNRIYQLTCNQHELLSRGKLELPENWRTPGYYPASFLLQILGESGAHLIDYVQDGHNGYGKIRNYSWDYFVDVVVRSGSVTLGQTDAHRPAQVVDKAIRNKLDQWSLSQERLPKFARRMTQFLMLSVPERSTPISETTIRCWQQLHELAYVVGGLFHEGIKRTAFRAEAIRAKHLLEEFHESLLAHGLRLEDPDMYKHTMIQLEAVSEELASEDVSLDWNYVFKVKRSLWRYVRYAGRELNKGSALRAIVKEIDDLKSLDAFYATLLEKIKAASRHVRHSDSLNHDAQVLLKEVSRVIMAEAQELGLRIDSDSSVRRFEKREKSPDQVIHKGFPAKKSDEEEYKELKKKVAFG